VNAAAEGAITQTAWSVELGVPGGVLTGALLGLVVAAVVLLGLADGRGLSPGRRAVLAGLRLATGLAVLALALQPRWLGERIQVAAGRLLLLVDGSGSMALPVGDEDGHPTTGGDEVTRGDRARRLADDWQRQTPAEVRQRVTTMVFGEPPLRPGTLPAVAERWPTTGAQTALAGALLDAAEGRLGDDLGAVVVVSDGRVTDAPAGALPVGALRRAGLVVHTVAVGRPFPDDAIVRVEADPVAFLHNEARVRAEVRADDLAGGTVPLTLRRDGEVVAETRVRLDEAGRGEGELAFLPRRLGREVYRLSIPWRAQDRLPANNERPFLLRVEREKLRVLHVVGSPSWDERFLRGFFEDDPAVDLVSFFILRTTGDLTLADPSELSLIPFPTEELFTEHLGSFDLVVFQNFDFRPYDMARHLPRIRDYVRRGGGFAMVGGELAFGTGGYRGTPVAEILPVRLPEAAVEGARKSGAAADDVAGGDAGAPGDPRILVEPFRPEVATPLHPIVALRADPEATRAAWAELVPVPGANRLGGLVGRNPRALLVHPTARTQAGDPMPVLAVGEPGDGRALALAIDASYRWGFGMAGETGDPSTYSRFWDRAVRWLTRDPSLEPSRIATDRLRHGPGSEMTVRGRLRDQGFAPLPGARTVIRLVTEGGAPVSRDPGESRSAPEAEEGDPSRQAEARGTPRAGEVEATTDGEGRFEVSLSAPEVPGVYWVEARAGTPFPEASASSSDEEGAGRTNAPPASPSRAATGSGAATVRAPFLVAPAGDEWAEPEPDPGALASLSEATGGRHAADPSDAPELDEIDTSRRERLGVELVAPLASPWAVLPVMLLLLMEWGVRRRWGRR
jgi:hypothetical protein